MRWQRVYNPAVILLLRSSLHGLISGSTMLISYTGARSGNFYTLPVNYVRDDRDLLCVSPSTHSWWKNLRGGSPVTVLLGGRSLRGTARAFEGDCRE